MNGLGKHTVKGGDPNSGRKTLYISLICGILTYNVCCVSVNRKQV